jgi:hypothetical protein
VKASSIELASPLLPVRPVTGCHAAAGPNVFNNQFGQATNRSSGLSSGPTTISVDGDK